MDEQRDQDGNARQEEGDVDECRRGEPLQVLKTNFPELFLGLSSHILWNLPLQTLHGMSFQSGEFGWLSVFLQWKIDLTVSLEILLF